MRANDVTNGSQSRLALSCVWDKVCHMSKSYVISWKARLGPATGRGKKVMDREEAERLAEELNVDYPEFIHEAVLADTGAGVEEEPVLEAVAA